MNNRLLNARRHALAAAVAALTTAAPAAYAVNYSWSSGQFIAGATAPSPLAAADVLSITAGGNKFFHGSASNFSNSGTVNWAADTLSFHNGVAVVNNALWNASSDNSLENFSNIAPSYTNNGSFRKSAGLGTTTIFSGVGFVNNGVIDAQTGTIEFNGIGLSTGAVFNAGSVFTGAGIIAVKGNSLFNGGFSSTNLVLSSGTQTGAGAVVGGTVNWSGATLAGTWTVGAGQTLIGTTGFIDGATLTNRGTVAWNSGSGLSFRNGGIVRNEGLFVVNGPGTGLSTPPGGASPTFENKAGGTLRAGAGSAIQVGDGTGFVNNGGILDALAGATIQYRGGSTFNAGTVFTGAGSHVAFGNNTWNGSFSAVNLELSAGGVHTGNGAVLTGKVLFAGGTLTGTWMVPAGQKMEMSGGSFFDNLDGPATVFTNLGTIELTSGLRLRNGATLSNQGLLLASGIYSIYGGVGPSPVLINTASGTVRVASPHTLTIRDGAGFVNNGGVLDAPQSGTIYYGGGSRFNAGTQFIGAGFHVANGDNTWSGAFNSANSLYMLDGVHTGAHAVINGSAGFYGGILKGTWQVAPGQTLVGAGYPDKIIDGAGTVVTNRGTFAWTNTDPLYLQNSAVLLNQGTLHFSADSSVFYNGGAAPSFVNTGLIIKSGGAGTTTIGDNLGFDNQGTIDVRTGTIALPTDFSNSGTLRGIGSYSVSGTLSNAGTVAPGASSVASLGNLELIGNFAQVGGGTFAVDLQSLTSHDLFNISGSAVLNGTLALSCFATCNLAAGDVLTILDSVGKLSGTFANVTLSGFGSLTFNVIYDTTLDRVQLMATVAPIPGTDYIWSTGDFIAGFTAPSPMNAPDRLFINAGSGKQFHTGDVFVNNANVLWTSDTLFGAGGAAVTNAGLWDSQSDNNIFIVNGATPTFTNTGEFRKSAGALMSMGNWAFVSNGGTWNAQVGTINFNGGNNTFNFNSKFTGAGAVSISSASVFNGNFYSDSLRLSSGVLTGNGARLAGGVANAAGTLAWAGADLRGSWEVAAGQTIRGVDGAIKQLNTTLVLTNNGILLWQTLDPLFMAGGATLTNNGLFEAQAAGTATLVLNGAASSFVNTATGTVRAAAGATFQTGNVSFINDGGTLNAAAGGQLAYNGSAARFENGTRFTGAGVNNVNSAARWIGSYTSGNLLISNGVQTGGDGIDPVSKAVAQGNTAWSGGELRGNWEVASGHTFRGVDGGTKQLNATLSLVNNGSILWQSTSALFMAGGATLTNHALFEAQANATLALNGAASTFVNSASGTVRALDNIAFATDAVAFTNNGGMLEARTGGSLAYNGGNATFNSGTRFTGNGRNIVSTAASWNGSFNSANLEITGGIQTANAAVLNGTALWRGGDLRGTWQIAPGQTLRAVDGGIKQLNTSLNLVNNGSILWQTSSTLFMANGAMLNNAGSFDIQADAVVTNNGGVANFNNSGLIVKSAGASTATIQTGVALNNLGTIDVRSGTLALPNNFVNNGVMKGTGTYSVGGTLANAGTVAPGTTRPATLSLSGNYAQTAAGTFAVDLESLTSSDLFNITGTASLAGTLALSCFASCSYAVGDVITILDSVGNLNGTFSGGLTLSGFASGAFNVIYDTAADRVQLVVTQAVTAVPEPQTYALLLAGLAVVGRLARRSRGRVA